MVDRRGETNYLPRDYIITDVEVREDRMLGEGAYGVVKLGRFYGLDCAVKKLKPSMFPAGMKQLDQQTELILQSFYNECEKMSRIRHPNVVQLLGVFADSNNRLPVIVMELMNESLSRLLHRTKVLPFHIEVNIVHDVAQALAYLHSFRPPIVHRDLSSNNILLGEGFRAKITDLGVAKVAKGSILNWDDTPAPGTLVYMPPEVRKVPADLTPAMDIFAIGVNMIQIRTHKFPRPGPEFISGRLGFSKMVPEKDRRRDHLDLIARSNPLKPLILDCIRDNPRDRPSGMKLCERLGKIKGEKDYIDSLQISKMRTENNGVDGLRDQVLLLEQKIIQLTEQLGHKCGQVDRLERDLDRERHYTAHLLEQSARDKLQLDMALAGMTSADSGISNSPPTQEDPKSSPKRNKKLIRLKQLLNKPSQSKKQPSKNLKRSESMQSSKRKHNSDSTSSDGSQTKSTAPSSPDSKSRRHHHSRRKDKKKVKRFSFTTNKLQAKAGNAEITEVVMEEQGEEEEEEEEEELFEDGEASPTSAAEHLEHEAELIKSLQLCTKHDFKLNKLTWYTHKCLPLGLHGSTLQLHLLGDFLYLCGGVTTDNIPNESILYCSTKNLSKWLKVGSGVPQFYCPSVVLEDELLLISGISAGDKRLTSALSSYNFSSRLWVQRHPPLPTPRSSPSAFVYREYLIVMGGQNERGEIVRTVDVLHLPTQHWYSAPPLLVPVAGASTVVCENIIYLVGGVGRSTWIQTVQCAKVRKIISYSHQSLPESQLSSKESVKSVWKRIHDCPFTKMTAVCSGNQLLTLGGEQLTRSAIADPSEWIWIYDKEDDTWSPVQGMPSARKLCAVTMLPDNMLIVGGEPHFNHIDIAEIL